MLVDARIDRMLAQIECGRVDEVIKLADELIERADRMKPRDPANPNMVADIKASQDHYYLFARRGLLGVLPHLDLMDPRFAASFVKSRTLGENDQATTKRTPQGARGKPQGSAAGNVPPVFAEYPKLSTYYQSPDPRLGPKLLTELLKKDNLEHPYFKENVRALSFNGALLAAIGVGHAQVVRDYEAAFADAPPAGRPLIIRALADCGDRDTVKRIDAWLADPRLAGIKPELEALSKVVEDPERKPAWDQPIKPSDDAERVWATFCISGTYAPVARVLDVLDVPDEIAYSATWAMKRWARSTLRVNLRQHPKLVELLKEHVKERPEARHNFVEQLLKEVGSAPEK
jgi:hypothetical protein